MMEARAAADPGCTLPPPGQPGEGRRSALRSGSARKGGADPGRRPRVRPADYPHLLEPIRTDGHGGLRLEGIHQPHAYSYWYVIGNRLVTRPPTSSTTATLGHGDRLQGDAREVALSLDCRPRIRAGARDHRQAAPSGTGSTRSRSATPPAPVRGKKLTAMDGCARSGPWRAPGLAPPQRR